MKQATTFLCEYDIKPVFNADNQILANIKGKSVDYKHEVDYKYCFSCVYKEENYNSTHDQNTRYHKLLMTICGDCLTAMARTDITHITSNAGFYPELCGKYILIIYGVYLEHSMTTKYRSIIVENPDDSSLFKVLHNTIRNMDPEVWLSDAIAVNLGWFDRKKFNNWLKEKFDKSIKDEFILTVNTDGIDTDYDIYTEVDYDEQATKLPQILCNLV